jgi:Tol biopolymer transport system component
VSGRRSIVERLVVVVAVMGLLAVLSDATTRDVSRQRGGVRSPQQLSAAVAFVQSRWESRGIGGELSEHVALVGPNGDDLRTVLPVSQEFNTYTRLAWSPDGARVAFARQMFRPGPGASIGPGEVVVMNADGTGQRVLATCARIWCGYGVTWSADGTRIAYQFKGIRVMDADGTNDHAIWDCSRGATCLRFNGPLSWSPDGKWMAFGGEDRDDVGGVFVVAAAGGTPKPITRCYSDLCYGGDRESNAAWSPDGSLIAFSRERNLFVIHPDGSGLRQISSCPTTTGYNGCTSDYPAWSADGQQLAFTDGHAIYVTSPAGETPKKIFDAPAGTPTPSPPTRADFRSLRVSYSICCLSWRPHGRTQPLAVTVPTSSPSAQSIPPIPPGVGTSIGPEDWAQFGGSAEHLGVNAAETAIGLGTVTSFHETWRSSVGDEALLGQSPAVVGDQLFVGGFDGNLYAFRAKGCGSSVCAPEWSGNTGGPIRSTPAVDLGAVFIGSTKGLFAFPASGCGSSSCTPLWEGATGGAPIEFSSPVVEGDSVYVGGGLSDGRLYAFDARGCGAKICAPAWMGVGLTKNGIWSAPAVSGGYVYVRGMDPYVYAFRVDGCGAKQCQPLWKGRAALQASEAPSAPLVANGLVYVGSGDCTEGTCGEYAFEATGCGSAVCDPVWFGPTYGGVGAAAALSGGTLFVTDWSGTLYAFDPLGCAHSSCDPLWAGAAAGMLGSTPVIANGLVFVSYRNSGGGDGVGAVAAFPVGGCGGPACKAVWSTTTGGAYASVVAISQGMLFVSGEDRIVHAYGLS